jgi:hypothetical protein
MTDARIPPCLCSGRMDDVSFSRWVASLGSNTVGLVGHLAVNCSKHRVLAASAGKDDLAVSDGAVVDVLGSFYIVGRALASLVVDGKSPRVHLACTIDGEAVVSSCSY